MTHSRSFRLCIGLSDCMSPQLLRNSFLRHKRDLTSPMEPMCLHRYVPGVRCRGALSRSERVRHAYDRSAYRPIAIHRRHFAWSESGPRAVICAGAARNCPVQQACQVRANLRYRAVNPISRMMRNADVFSTFVRCGTHLNRGVDPDGGLYPCDEVRQSWRH